jgi:hypothetical protein
MNATTRHQVPKASPKPTPPIELSLAVPLLAAAPSTSGGDSKGKRSGVTRTPVVNGLDARFAQNSTLRTKVVRNQSLSQTFVLRKVIARDRRMLGNSLSKPSFRTSPKANHRANTSLACLF